MEFQIVLLHIRSSRSEVGLNKSNLLPPVAATHMHKVAAPLLEEINCPGDKHQAAAKLLARGSASSTKSIATAKDAARGRRIPGVNRSGRVATAALLTPTRP